MAAINAFQGQTNAAYILYTEIRVKTAGIRIVAETWRDGDLVSFHACIIKINIWYESIIKVLPNLQCFNYVNSGLPKSVPQLFS